MKDKLISIIVPVYNGEKYLADCLDSILAQTYSNFELILVDDGSTDDSFSICKNFEKKDKRVHVYKIKNSGAGGARNKGLELAKGEFIAFVDGDDVVSKDYLSNLLAGINQETDLSCATYKNFSDRISFSDDHCSAKEVSNVQAIEDLLLGKLAAGPVCKLYKRELIRELRFENFAVAEDLFFNYQYLKSCKNISTSSDVIYGYRENSSSLTKANFKLSRMDGLKALSEVAAQEKFSEAACIRLFMEAYYIIEILDKYGQLKKHPKQVKECKDIVRKYRRKVLFSKISPKKQRIIAFFSFASPILPAKIINLITR